MERRQLIGGFGLLAAARFGNAGLGFTERETFSVDLSRLKLCADFVNAAFESPFKYRQVIRRELYHDRIWYSSLIEPSSFIIPDTV